MVVARSERRGEWVVIFTKYKVSFFQDEKNSGDGW